MSVRNYSYHISEKDLEHLLNLVSLLMTAIKDTVINGRLDEYCSDDEIAYYEAISRHLAESSSPDLQQIF